jgi:NAD(P)H dehydrogenase (quinone)
LLMMNATPPIVYPSLADFDEDFQLKQLW